MSRATNVVFFTHDAIKWILAICPDEDLQLDVTWDVVYQIFRYIDFLLNIKRRYDLSLQFYIM